jgi:hypothetical protein
MSHPRRLRGDPVRMVFKNFLPNHQLDIHLWTEFLCMWCRQYCPSHHVSRKRTRLLLDSRVVGFADVVQPNCCHPFLT